jgi:hypothetical protein
MIEIYVICAEIRVFLVVTLCSHISEFINNSATAHTIYHVMVLLPF